MSASEGGALKRWALALALQALVALAHGVLAGALGLFLGPVSAGCIALPLWGLAAARWWALFRRGRRPRWVVKWVDLPVFTHTGGVLGMLGVAAVVWPLGREPGVATPALVTGFGPAAALAYLTGLLLASWGIWGERGRLRVRQVEVPLACLPSALDGYRIVHLSDLHIGDFVPAERASGWVQAANELAPDLCVVTGDLIARQSGCVHAATLVIAALRARDGVVVTLGNHDRGEAEALTSELRASGVTVLRNQWHRLARGNQAVDVLGLDDWRTLPADVGPLVLERASAEPFLLLAHRYRPRPWMEDLPIALMLSGHSHGGQIGVPLLARWLNVATLTGQRARGLFRLRYGWGMVTAGLGTSGPPLRLGVAPEMTLLVLRRGPDPGFNRPL